MQARPWRRRRVRRRGPGGSARGSPGRSAAPQPTSHSRVRRSTAPSSAVEGDYAGAPIAPATRSRKSHLTMRYEARKGRRSVRTNYGRQNQSHPSAGCIRVAVLRLPPLTVPAQSRCFLGCPTRTRIEARRHRTHGRDVHELRWRDRTSCAGRSVELGTRSGRQQGHADLHHGMQTIRNQGRAGLQGLARCSDGRFVRAVQGNRLLSPVHRPSYGQCREWTRRFRCL